MEVKLITKKNIQPKRLLDELYDRLAQTFPEREKVRFRGVEYNIGSKKLKDAIDVFYQTLK